MLLEKLFGFFHVAYEQSFTKASVKINISQPNLSKYISSLEKHFGKKLIYKQNRKVYLTDEGKILYETAKKMIEDYQRTEEMIRHTSDELAGPLRIGTGVSMAQSWGIDIFAKFNLAYPNIKLIITGTDREPELVNGNFDVVISPNIYVDPTKYCKEHFSNVEWSFFASQSYVNEHGKPKNLEDLRHHKLVSFYQKERHIFGNVNPHLSVGITDLLPKLPDFAVNSGMALTRAIGHGLGVGLLQKKAPYLKGLNLVELDICDLPPIEMYLIYAKHLKTSKKIQTFCNFFKEAYKEQYI